MLENTIVFGNFAVTILIVILGKLFAYKKKSKLDIISLVIVAASVILTFGRIAIIGGLFSIILTYIYCSRKNSLGRAFKIIIILVVVFGVVFAFFGDSIVVKRLIGEGTSTNVSNQIHMEKAQNGLQAVLQNWLLGVGNGTQGYTRGNLTAIVSDGGWLSWALELGVPTTLVFFAVFFAFLVFSNKCKKEYTDEFNIWINSAAVTTMVIFMFSSIFNSSYLARANYGISWLLIGLSLATNRVFNMSNVKLSIIIVSYNNLNVLLDCLNSVEKMNDISDQQEVIVVEQSPSDEIYTYLKKNMPQIQTIRAENKGFGAGNNRVVEIAQG